MLIFETCLFANQCLFSREYGNTEFSSVQLCKHLTTHKDFFFHPVSFFTNFVVTLYNSFSLTAYAHLLQSSSFSEVQMMFLSDEFSHFACALLLYNWRHQRWFKSHYENEASSSQSQRNVNWKVNKAFSTINWVHIKPKVIEKYWPLLSKSSPYLKSFYLHSIKDYFIIQSGFRLQSYYKSVWSGNAVESQKHSHDAHPKWFHGYHWYYCFRLVKHYWTYYPR